MGTAILICSLAVWIGICIDVLREEWGEWRTYRKELRAAETKADRERIKVLHWLNSGKM